MGYEVIVEDPEWRPGSRRELACPQPTVTRHHGLASVEGINMDREVGLGSIWRCDRCRRCWILKKHNTIAALMPTESVEAASLWIPVDH